MSKIRLEEFKYLENKNESYSTYIIINLKLSKLFNEILKVGRKGTIPILETRLLLRILRDIPLLNKDIGTEILRDLTICMENHWYSIKDKWNWRTIVKGLKKLQKLVFHDYIIIGSLMIYQDKYINWNVHISMICSTT